MPGPHVSLGASPAALRLYEEVRKHEHLDPKLMSKVHRILQGRLHLLHKIEDIEDPKLQRWALEMWRQQLPACLATATWPKIVLDLTMTVLRGAGRAATARCKEWWEVQREGERLIRRRLDMATRSSGPS